MTRLTFARTLMFFVTISLCANTVWAQNQKRVPGIPGYLDPLTGEFRSMMPPAQQDAEASPAAISGGTFVFKFTITVASRIASTTTIFCDATAQVSDSNGVYDEGAAVSVARGTGSTVTCTESIPYSWALNNGSSDQVLLGYSISAAPSSSTALRQRFSTHIFPPIKVPANGAVTTTNISATI